jgi:hypothetical protein
MMKNDERVEAAEAAVAAMREALRNLYLHCYAHAILALPSGDHALRLALARERANALQEIAAYWESGEGDKADELLEAAHAAVTAIEKEKS